MKVFVKSLKRVGLPVGATFAPVTSMRLNDKGVLVPQTQMIPVVMVALTDQLVIAPAGDLLMLWEEDEVDTLSALEVEIATRIAEATTEAVPDVETTQEIGTGTCDGDACGNCEGGGDCAGGQDGDCDNLEGLQIEDAQAGLAPE